METLDGNCNHPGSLGNNCCVCGNWQETRRNWRRRDQHMGIMESHRKLYLVLDLDHTLLNSIEVDDMTTDEFDYLKTLVRSQDKKSLLLFWVKSMGIITKLRPFVRTFLKEVNEMFDLCIYTMGNRCYARKMAKLLDPKGVYFNDRIFSREDCTVRGKKSLDVVTGDEEVVLIVDDTKNVWSKKHQGNLIEIERYHFFAWSCKQFKQDSKSLSELKMDENEYDGALSTVLDILKRTHRLFFDKTCKDVRSVLKLVRQTGHSNPTRKAHKPPPHKGDGQTQTTAAMFLLLQNKFYVLSDITT